MPLTAAAFGRRTGAGVVDHDVAHCARRHGEEMRAVVPRDLRRIDETQIGLVDECRRVQRIAALETAETTMCHQTQLVINEREEFVERAAVAASYEM